MSIVAEKLWKQIRYRPSKYAFKIHRRLGVRRVSPHSEAALTCLPDNLPILNESPRFSFLMSFLHERATNNKAVAVLPGVRNGDPPKDETDSGRSRFESLARCTCCLETVSFNVFTSCTRTLCTDETLSGDAISLRGVPWQIVWELRLVCSPIRATEIKLVSPR